MYCLGPRPSLKSKGKRVWARYGPVQHLSIFNSDTCSGDLWKTVIVELYASMNTERKRERERGGGGGVGIKSTHLKRKMKQ